MGLLSVILQPLFIQTTTIIFMRQEQKYFSYELCAPNVHLVKVEGASKARKDFEEFLAFSEKSAREMKGAVILDVSKTGLLTPGDCQQFHEVLDAHAKSILRNWTSIAYVNSSRLGRWIQKAWLQWRPLPIRCQVFKSVDEAVSWSYRLFLHHHTEQIN
jgi:hypothetical protein